MTSHESHFQAVAAQSLDELLSLYDESFVRCAYLTLLRREVDPSGLTNYASQLRRGAAKAQLIAELFDSEEGRNAGVQLPGLTELVASSRQRPPSLLRRVCARISSVLLAPLAPQLRALDNEIHAIEDRAEQRFRHLHTALGALQRSTPLSEGSAATKLQDTNQHIAVDLIAALSRTDLSARAAVFASRLGVALNTHRGRAQ